MERPSPPYRADHVGSLIRPKELIEARRGHTEGQVSTEELRRIEDEAVREAVAMQEGIGLRSITDGEFRRQTYLTQFLNSIGVELRQQASPDLFYYDNEGRQVIRGTGSFVRRKLKWTSSPNLEAFRFLKSVTRQTPKVTLPAPTQAHFFAATTGISKDVYPDMGEFWDDIVACYRAELRTLADAGCTYVQIDETCLPKLADPAIQEVVKRRGQDWPELIDQYIQVLNRIIDGKPESIHLALHHCRGNQAGLWQAQAGYEAVAEAMFGQLHIGAYLLEYDTARAGDFAPLRFLPIGKVAVLGLVSTKNSRLEQADELKRRIDEASKYVALERLCVGPQCGFSSGFASAQMTQQEQASKLERLVEVARQVWGV